MTKILKRRAAADDITTFCISALLIKQCQSIMVFVQINLHGLVIEPAMVSYTHV